MSSKGGWGTAVAALVALVIWQDGCAGQAAVTAAGTAAAGGAAVGAGAAAAGASSAGAIAAAKALAGQQRGQHAAGKSKRSPTQAATTVLCPQADGTMGLCSSVVPGASSAEPATAEGPPCNLSAEPRQRVLPDADGDGEPERITLPELGCH